MNFFVNALEHEFIIILFLCSLVIIVFISKNFIKPFIGFIHNFPKKIAIYCQQKSNHRTSKDIALEYEKLSQKQKILANICNQIANLNSPDPGKIQTSIQQLLEYPSPRGTIAIVQFALKLEKPSARAGLICELCNSLSTYQDDWYE